MTDSGTANTEAPANPDYPEAAKSLMAARQIVGRRAKGTVKFTRRYVSGDLATWRAEAKLISGEGIDYEVEIDGASPDEVAYVLLSTLEQIWTTLDGEG